MGLSIVTPPTAWPITLEQAKAQLRLAPGAGIEDSFIQGLIASATKHVENYIGVSLAKRTYRLTLDTFSDAIELLRGPVQSVTAVRSLDASGQMQALSNTAYSVDLASDRQWIVRNRAAGWPTLMDAINAVEVEYVAGFDELPEDYADAQRAILVMLTAFYEDREGGEMFTAADRSMRAICRSKRRWGL